MDPDSHALCDALPELSLKEAPLGKFRPHRKVENITTTFNAACEKLQPSQLVKDDSFSLWDGVQALEVMDPKMDSGFIEEGRENVREFDVTLELLPQEIIWIMDEIFSREAAFLRGFALFQTVLTSTHVLHLIQSYQRGVEGAIPSFLGNCDTDNSKTYDSYTHLCLRAFCLATVIQCDFYIDLVDWQHHYGEEDLNTQTYGLNLCSGIHPEEQPIKLLDEALNWLRARNPSEEMVLEDAAIFNRLETRRSLLNIFVEHELSPAVLNARMDSIQASNSLGRPIHEAFNSKVYRKLPISGPIRSAASLPLDVAVSDFTRLLEDLIENDRHVELGARPSDDDLRIFLWQLASRTPHPSAVPRARLQGYMFCEGGHFDEEKCTERMVAEMCELGLHERFIDDLARTQLESHPSSWEYQRATYLQEFMQKAYLDYAASARALCQNRHRIRRCLVNASQDMIGLRDETIVRFQDSHDPIAVIVSRLVTQYVGRHAQWIILLGFEFELYESYEIGLMYYTLARVSYAMSSDFRPHRQENKEEDAWRGFHSFTKKYELEAIQLMALGFSTFWHILQELKVLPQSSNIDDINHSNAWHMRIEPLVGAPGMHGIEDYDNAVKACKPNSSAMGVTLDRADEQLREARRRFTDMKTEPAYAKCLFSHHPRSTLQNLVVHTWKQDLERLIKANVEMSLNINALKKAIWPKESGATVTTGVKPGFEINVSVMPTEKRWEKGRDGKPVGHAWWIVPQVTIKLTSEIGGAE